MERAGLEVLYQLKGMGQNHTPARVPLAKHIAQHHATAPRLPIGPLQLGHLHAGEDRHLAEHVDGHRFPAHLGDADGKRGNGGNERLPRLIRLARRAADKIWREDGGQEGRVSGQQRLQSRPEDTPDQSPFTVALI